MQATIVIFFLACIADITESVSITIYPDTHARVNQGDSVRFECSTNATGRCTLLNNETSVMADRHGSNRFHLVSSTTCVIEAININVSDSGRYVCQHGGMHSEFRLSVTIMPEEPESISIRVDPPGNIINPYGAKQLICESSLTAAGDHMILKRLPDGNWSPVSYQSTIYISQPGVYMCMVRSNRNESYIASPTITIRRLANPNIQQVRVKQGDSLRFECSKNTTSRCGLFKKGKMVADILGGKKFRKVEYADSWRTPVPCAFEATNLDVSDGGRYICRMDHDVETEFLLSVADVVAHPVVVCTKVTLGITPCH